jgi:hypothetical protein
LLGDVQEYFSCKVLKVVVKTKSERRRMPEARKGGIGGKEGRRGGGRDRWERRGRGRERRRKARGKVPAE